MIRELIDAWRSKDILSQMYDGLIQMLDDTEWMFRGVCGVLFEGKSACELGEELYQRDVRVNETERRIRIFCPTAYLSMDYQKKTGIAIKLDDNLDLIRMARERNFEDLSQMQNLDFGSMMKVEPLQVDDVEPLRAEIESFLESIRKGTEAAVSAEEGYAAVEMAEKITNSVREQDWGRGLAETVRS